jgi:hypothetical protein
MVGSLLKTDAAKADLWQCKLSQLAEANWNRAKKEYLKTKCEFYQIIYSSQP